MFLVLSKSGSLRFIEVPNTTERIFENYFTKFPHQVIGDRMTKEESLVIELVDPSNEFYRLEEITQKYYGNLKMWKRIKELVLEKKTLVDILSDIENKEWKEVPSGKEKVPDVEGIPFGGYMSKRIEEIKKRLIELEKLHKPLYDEDYRLRKEMDELSTTLAEEVIKDITWELSYDPVSYSSSEVVLTSEIQEEREKANDKLWELSGGHQHPFDISNTVYISMDDGELHMHFTTLKDFKSYIKTNPLKIDYTRFKENLDNFKNDIKNLEEMMSILLED